MKQFKIRAGRAALGLGAVVAITCVSASAVDAASWVKQQNGDTANCQNNLYTLAGYVNVLDAHDGSCFINSTTTSQDTNLASGDTWADLSPVAPGFNRITQQRQSGAYVRFYQNTSCSGVAQNISTGFNTNLNWYSFEYNASNGC